MKITHDTIERYQTEAMLCGFTVYGSVYVPANAPETALHPFSQFEQTRQCQSLT
jgi:hypothetical protein